MKAKQERKGMNSESPPKRTDLTNASLGWMAGYSFNDSLKMRFWGKDNVLETQREEKRGRKGQCKRSTAFLAQQGRFRLETQKKKDGRGDVRWHRWWHSIGNQQPCAQSWDVSICRRTRLDRPSESSLFLDLHLFHDLLRGLRGLLVDEKYPLYHMKGSETWDRLTESFPLVCVDHHVSNIWRNPHFCIYQVFDFPYFLNRQPPLLPSVQPSSSFNDGRYSFKSH